MQPYFFPYLGYWQLINVVDKFIIYDDVAYINKGWVNRNLVLINGISNYITVPLNKASQNKLICDLQLDASTEWQKKILKKISYNYRKAPQYGEVFPLIERLLNYNNSNLAEYLSYQITMLSKYLDIKTEFGLSSTYFENDHLKGQERIIDICHREEAKNYVNLSGGRKLYSQNKFKESSIDLAFIKTLPISYQQKSKKFVENLSIIDVMMYVSHEKINKMINNYFILES